MAGDHASMGLGHLASQHAPSYSTPAAPPSQPIPAAPAGFGAMDDIAAPAGSQKLRSEAERDLLRALRAAR
jgi:hypothetical protein